MRHTHEDLFNEEKMKIIKNGSVNAEEESSNKIMENNKEFKNKDHYEDM